MIYFSYNFAKKWGVSGLNHLNNIDINGNVFIMSE